MGKGDKNAGDAGNAVEVVAAEPDRSQDPRTPTTTSGTKAMGSSGVTPQIRAELISELMARYCQLGRLLAMEDIDTDHDAQLAEVKTVCSERRADRARPATKAAGKA